MAHLVEPSTRLSLLLRLQNSEGMEDASNSWHEFYSIYQPVIMDWCLRRKVPDADAKDVAQSVFIKLLKNINSFKPSLDKKFRAWLWMIVKHTIFDLRQESARWQYLRESGIMDSLCSVESVESLYTEIDQACPEVGIQLEALVGKCIEQVRKRTNHRTLEAFLNVTIQNVDAAVVAEDLGMSVGGIRAAKHRMSGMLNKEFEGVAKQLVPPQALELGLRLF